MKKQTEFEPNYGTLQGLIDELCQAGYTSDDFKNFHFDTELDYDGIYYEGDEPRAKVMLTYVKGS